MSESELTPGKLAVRRTVRAQRARRSAQESAAVADALAAVALELPALRTASCVALYAEMPGEPGTGRLRAELRSRGTRVLLPVVDGDDLDWAEDDGSLTPGALAAIQEPTGTRLGQAGIAAADVVLVPAQAVDTHGTRLGRGRGFYDRALTRVAPGALLIALVHDEELLDAETTPIAHEPHDVRVHAVITPTRWVRLTAET